MNKSAITQRINNAKKYPHLHELHPTDRANYLAGKYNKKDELRFLCPICGEYYLQSPQNKQKGYMHRTCSNKQNGINQRVDETYHSFNDLTPEYQEKCRNKELTTKTRVDFVCNICGEIYSTLLNSHTKGANCSSCSYKANSRKQIKTDYTFLNEVRKDFQEKILNREITSQVKVPFICEEHGEYWQTLNNHSKHGCPDCGKIKKVISKRKRDYDFILEVREDFREKIISGEINSYDKVPFICKEHGEYWQEMNNHNKGQGCPLCQTGRNPYSFYEWLLILTDNIIVNDREQIKPLEIDFYLPDYNIGFEFNDIRTHQTLFNEQEANARNFGGKPQTYHHNKFKICKEKGIRLIQIWDIEWSDDRIRPILESVIKNALGMNERRFYARKCELVISNSKECNPFFNENHIQGPARGNGYFALKYEGEVVGAICYAKKIKLVQTGNKNNADTTISRMCFKQNTSVIGGASRLLKAVMNLMEEGQVIEYLVLNDYFNGVSFEATGWENAKHYSMVRYYDTEKQHSYYRDPHKYQERKQKCLDGTMNRYFTSGTTVYRKEKAPSL